MCNLCSKYDTCKKLCNDVLKEINKSLGTRKINSDKIRALAIACSIIFIEFAMNVSYFMTEIGGDLQGIFLSLIAALVPTALLIAETLMLSQTRFEIFACDELISKIDKD